MLSCKVLKPEMVTLDTENKVVIDITMPEIEYREPCEEEEEFDAPDTEEQAQNTAALIIRQAEIQAEEIVSRARITAIDEQTTIRREAKNDATREFAVARDNGYSEGMASATKEGNVIKAEAKKILEDAKAERKQLQESLEPEMVNLVISVVDKLLGDAVALDPGVVLHLIKQGLSSAAMTGDVTVYVSAQDFEQVQARKDELLALTDGSVKL